MSNLSVREQYIIPTGLPDQIIRDLLENGGENVTSIAGKLSNEFSEFVQEKRRLMTEEHNFALIIAACLALPPERPSHRLAKRLLEDYLKRNRELDEFNWEDEP